MGLALLAYVAWIYVAEGKLGRSPGGHPWSGLSLALLGMTALLWPARTWRAASRASLAVRILVIALAVGSGALWAWGGHREPSGTVGL